MTDRGQVSPEARYDAALGLLAKAVESHIQGNGVTFAYDRCLVCGATWYGPRTGREYPEPERHNLDCWLPDARVALRAWADSLRRRRPAGTH